MKILVTGATGFVGSAFIKVAVDLGHRIAALVRPEKVNAAKRIFPENVKILAGSLVEVPLAEIEEFGAETCVHAAWLATPGVYLESPENELWTKWSLNFLRQIAKAGTTHVLALGTCIEYQISDTLLSEQETLISPTSTYARCKNELRLALEAEKDISLCWGRIFYPYGPGEHPDRFCSSLIRKVLSNQKLVLKTPGSTKDYIFIDDLACAISTVVEKRYIGAINLGSGRGVQIREIARTIAEEMNRLDLIEEVSPAPRDPFGYVVADASRLRSLGWEPKTTLREGIKKLMVSIQSGN